MKKHLILAFIAVTVVMLAAVIPAAAVLAPNGTVCELGATIYIGEQGLNLTHAFNVAQGQGSEAVPVLTKIGWWAGGANIYSTAPTRTIEFGSRYRSTTVTPEEFVGYTGNWYLLAANGINPANNNARVFIVADPTLDVRVWDFTTNADVTGSSVPQGEKLGFRIDTSMYPAVDYPYRGNVIEFSGAAASVTPFYQANNILIDCSGLWDNSTLPKKYYNYTSGGNRMTWGVAGGCEGGFRLQWQPFYYNAQNNRFYNDPELLQLSTNVVLRTTNDYQDQNAPVAATDGFIDIRIRDPYDSKITSLYNQSSFDTILLPGPYSTLKNFVDTQPFYWGHPLNGNDVQTGNVWDTGALNSSSLLRYVTGTYTITAESRLNNMRANYQNGGADFTGKTVSVARTITLTRPALWIGLFRPSTRTWSFDTNLNGVTDKSFPWGSYGDIPLTSDFNGDGTPDIGVFRSGQWILDYGMSRNVDRRFQYGLATDKPLVGDFNNDGTMDIGVFRSGQWILDYGIDGTVNRRFSYGLATDKPLVGDFNNDGTTDIGVFRSGQWILDYGMNGITDRRFQYGLATDTPLVGDFDKDGTTDIGVFRSGQWILDYGMSGTVDRRFQYGLATDKPLVANYHY